MTAPTPPSWFIVVDSSAIERHRATLRDVAARLDGVDVDDWSDGLLLVPRPGVHPATVAVRVFGLLATALRLRGDERVRLVVDVGPGPDRAYRLAAPLRWYARDAPLLFAVTHDAWLALGQDPEPVPLRGFQRILVADGGEDVVVWVRVPDDPGEDSSPTGYDSRPFPGQGSVGRSTGPPPGPDFPTDR